MRLGKIMKTIIRAQMQARASKYDIIIEILK